MSQKGERTVPGTLSITLNGARRESGKFTKENIIKHYRNLGKSLRYSGKKKLFYVSHFNNMSAGIPISNLVGSGR